MCQFMYKNQEKICCKNVPEMYILGKISKKIFF